MLPARPVVTVEDLYVAERHLFDVTYQRWIGDVLFTFNWWFLTILMIVPWILWWTLVDKKRLFEIVTVGLMAMLLATLLDVIGVAFSLWIYAYKVIQMIAPLNPVDLTDLPIEFMLIYQWFPKWKWYFLAVITLGGVDSFVAEPLFVWMKIYVLIQWRYIYSLPIYIGMGFAMKGVVQGLMSIQDREKGA